jgi:hypothetical protein
MGNKWVVQDENLLVVLFWKEVVCIGGTSMSNENKVECKKWNTK